MIIIIVSKNQRNVECYLSKNGINDGREHDKTSGTFYIKIFIQRDIPYQLFV